MSINYYLNQNPQLTEIFYFENIYKTYRELWSAAFGQIRFSLFYLWLLFFILILLYLFIERKRNHKEWKILIIHVIVFICAHISYFYLAWGFNYGRETISERLGIQTEILKTEFDSELISCLHQINEFRKINEINFTSNLKQLNQDLEDQISQFLKMSTLPYCINVKSKSLNPSGALLVWSTAGIYWPFAGESMIDGGLHPLEIPFTMAHELAHGMGWTDEGECNWIAYEACIRNKDPYICYSGMLSYFKYLIYQIPENDSLIYDSTIQSLNQKVKDDLASIREKHNQFPDFFPKWRNAFYNWYLKNNKIMAGMDSYGQVVNLVIHYRKKGLNKLRSDPTNGG